jgi:hypothetical protein
MVAAAAGTAATDRHLRLKIETMADTPLAIASPVDPFAGFTIEGFGAVFDAGMTTGFG